jgi:hypothetical protein
VEETVALQAVAVERAAVEETVVLQEENFGGTE